MASPQCENCADFPYCPDVEPGSTPDNPCSRFTNAKQVEQELEWERQLEQDKEN